MEQFARNQTRTLAFCLRGEIDNTRPITGMIIAASGSSISPLMDWAADSSCNSGTPAAPSYLSPPTHRIFQFRLNKVPRNALVFSWISDGGNDGTG
jgi:hypothetical protein